MRARRLRPSVILRWCVVAVSVTVVAAACTPGGDEDGGGDGDNVELTILVNAEFSAAGYLEPMSEVVGDQVDDWEEGWDLIPESVQGSLELEGEPYGIPFGTDGRVLFFNKKLFEQAGLPQDWQPESWDDIIETARTLKEELPNVTPLQLNAGISMGEATTLQGFVPILNGTSRAMYDEESGQWLGDTPELRSTFEFFNTIYSEELGDAQLQQRADGRDRSFQQFAQERIAILAESDYFWRDVVSPGSEEAILDFVERESRITAREDVNEQMLGEDQMLQYISEEVFPITWYRPGFEEYPQISIAVTEALEGLVAGNFDVEQAAAEYTFHVQEIVGEERVLTE
jgi:hypothetical protein